MLDLSSINRKDCSFLASPDKTHDFTGRHPSIIVIGIISNAADNLLTKAAIVSPTPEYMSLLAFNVPV